MFVTEGTVRRIISEKQAKVYDRLDQLHADHERTAASLGEIQTTLRVIRWAIVVGIPAIVGIVGSLHVFN